MEHILPSELFTDRFQRYIFVTLRIPRVVMGVLGGGGLAVCGLIYQALFRNPLASPYTLGIASGASFGAACVILSGIGGSLLGLSLTSFGAIAGAFVAVSLVYTFSVVTDIRSSVTLLLSGVAVGFIFSSLLMFIHFIGSSQYSFRILRWIMGGVDSVSLRSIAVILPLYLTGLVIVVVRLPALDQFAAGEDVAQSRGVAVQSTKLVLLFATSCMVSSIVAVCGPIGFIGIMAPHVSRMLFRYRHRILVPAAFCVGGLFLLVSDAIARTIIAPAEIPVGVITAMLGGPFFLWILFGKRYGNYF
jgi:iron complex transport system permease protein